MEKDLLGVLIETIREFSNNKDMKELNAKDLNYISQQWINGISYFQILKSCNEKSINIKKEGS